MQVAHAGRQRRLAPPPVEEGQIVTQVGQTPDRGRADEARAAEDQNAHDWQRITCPGRRHKRCPDGEQAVGQPAIHLAREPGARET
jgi:hypothetical protein